MTASGKILPPLPRIIRRLVDVDGCWEFTGARDTCGYGVLSVNGKRAGAHRVVWAAVNLAEIPKGMVVMHSCDNPPCCHPGHLVLGTPRDNMIDRSSKGRAPIKFSHETIARARRLHSVGLSHSKISAETGISEGYVGAIVNNQARRTNEPASLPTSPFSNVL